jgi:hypothetical protein
MEIQGSLIPTPRDLAGLEVVVDYVLGVQGGAYLCGENEAKEKESSPSA